MITLSKKLKKSNDEKRSANANVLNANATQVSRRISVRDKLLVKEVQEMESNLPSSCRIRFDDPHQLHSFELTISPEEGYWQGGKFRFNVYVTEEYNMVPPIVKCKTRLWHPNITEEGEICLSLLRENSIDGLGWAPTRRLKDVVWGLNSLFTDLLNFDDPLNIDAADHYQRDKDAFSTKVKDYVQKYALR